MKLAAFQVASPRLALLVALPVRAQEKAEKVEKQDELKFEQDKAQAHMRELEERMFRLANLIRDAQPDDSARLLMGVRKAREHLIADRMQEASTLLASLRLDQATGAQQEIIDQLEELKRLLLSADIDLELKLEQLRKLREARMQLDKLIENPAFWNDQKKSQDVMRERRKLLDVVENDQELERRVSDLETFFELAREGEAVEKEIRGELKTLKQRVEEMLQELHALADSDLAPNLARPPCLRHGRRNLVAACHRSLGINPPVDRRNDLDLVGHWSPLKFARQF